MRRDGDWDAWVSFFAEGVAETAEGAVSTARRLLEIAERDVEKIQRLGRSAGSAAAVHRSLQSVPVSTVSHLVARTKLTLPTVLKALDVLAGLGVVEEITGKQRHRVYRYNGYMNVLSEGTEPL